jgi:hypothetical protein
MGEIMKKIWIGIVAVVLLIVLATSVVYAFDFGIQKIRFSGISEEEFRVDIHYADCSGYSVQYVEDGEVLHYGEMPKSFDDYLPANRVRITVGDCEMSEDVKEKYEAWTAYKIEQADGDVYFMWCPNSDHGNYLFFASDSELYVEEQEFTKLAAPIGKISVRIKTKDASQ